MAVPSNAPTGRLFQGALAANGRSKLLQAVACVGSVVEAEQLAAVVGVAKTAARAGKQFVVMREKQRDDRTKGHFGEVGMGRSRRQYMGGLRR